MSKKKGAKFSDDIQDDSDSSDSSSSSDEQDDELPEFGNNETLFEGHCATDTQRYGCCSRIMYSWVDRLVKVFHFMLNVVVCQSENSPSGLLGVFE